MKYIGGIITAYIVLLVLDIMQRRNHTRTQSLKKFTVRTITDEIGRASCRERV